MYPPGIYDHEKSEKIALYRDIFTYCSAVLVLLMFFILGTVLDIKSVKTILHRPICPFIAFCGRYIFMPLLAIALGQLLLRDRSEEQLGLLFTAVSPGGGLGNVFIIFLKGNINLSLTITMTNNLLGFAMLSFWILSVIPKLPGHSFIKVPFLELSVSAFAVIVAICLGMVFRQAFPTIICFIYRFLKPILTFLSVSLLTLTVGLNFYVFKDLTLNIFIAACLLPFIGYFLSFGLSTLMRRSFPDAMTIAVETSVLTITIPILLLTHCFSQPQLDTIIVIPIVYSLISLIMVILYIVRRVMGWNVRTNSDCFDEKIFLIKT